MNKLIVLLMLSSISQAATLSWNSEVLKEAERATTIRELTCSTQSAAGRELCELFKKDQGVKNKIRIQRLNESTISIQSGSRTVKIERGDKRYRFLLNDQLLDLSKYPNQERVGFAIEAVLAAKKSAGFSFVNRAWAAGPDYDPSIKAQIQSLFVMQNVYDLCVNPSGDKKDAYLKFVETCEADSEPIYTYLKNTSQSYRESNKKQIKDAIDKKLSQVTQALSRIDGDINSKYGNARSCDCKANPGQRGCGPEADKDRIYAEGRDPYNMTEPRQKGMHRCQHLLKQIASIPDYRDFLGADRAREALEEIDKKLLDIKADAPPAGLPSHSSK